MNRVLNFIGIVLLFLVSASVFVNINPSVFGCPIEVLIILSGTCGLLVNSFSGLIVLPAFSSIIMTAFGEGVLIYNLALCVSFALLIYYFKNRKSFYTFISAMLIFVLRQANKGGFGVLFTVINTMIFCIIYSFFAFVAKRRVKDIF